MTDSRLWHVTVTVSGQPQPPADTKAALGRLQHERPFIHAIRFDLDRAEIKYWEESTDMVDAASLALRLWNEHRASAGLPDWKVVGLEVLDRGTFQRREDEVPLRAVGVHPSRF